MGTMSSRCCGLDLKREHERSEADTSRHPDIRGSAKVKLIDGRLLSTSDTDLVVSRQPIDLSEREKEIIKETWREVEKNAEEQGPISFVNLFEMPPSSSESDNGEFVPFKSIEVDNDRYNRILRNHGLKVLNTISKMVTRLDTQQKMVHVPTALGSRHRDYNVDACLIEKMCPHFVKAIEMTLKNHWCDELESAYKHLFQLLEFHMRTALLSPPPATTL